MVRGGAFACALTPTQGQVDGDGQAADEEDEDQRAHKLYAHGTKKKAHSSGHRGEVSGADRRMAGELGG